MKRIIAPLGAAALALSLPIPAYAAVIIGNLPQSGPPDSGTTISPTAQAAFKFTPNQTYNVTSVLLVLENYRTIAGGGSDVPVVGFFTDSGGAPNNAGNVPTTTQVGSLLTFPESSAGSGVTATYTFTAVSGTITLSANTPYWLVVDASAGGFFWKDGPDASPDVPLTGDAATDTSPYRTSSDNGSSYIVSSHPAGLQINGDLVVPEPHEYAMVAGMGLLAFGFWRRRAAMA